MLDSLEEIKRLNKASGRFFFSPTTLRFFSSRVSETVYPVPDGAIFVTSERAPQMPRFYTVRHAFDSGEIYSPDGFQNYRSLSRAHGAAKRLAKAQMTTPYLRVNMSEYLQGSDEIDDTYSWVEWCNPRDDDPETTAATIAADIVNRHGTFSPSGTPITDHLLTMHTMPNGERTCNLWLSEETTDYVSGDRTETSVHFYNFSLTDMREIVRLTGVE